MYLLSILFSGAGMVGVGTLYSARVLAYWAESVARVGRVLTRKSTTLSRVEPLSLVFPTCISCISCISE